MKHVMVDLETLALSSNALILSIGAVEFSPEMGIGREFYVVAKQDKQAQKWGREVDPDTMAWWNRQTYEARKVLMDPSSVYLDAALGKFAEWLGGEERYVWGNGAHFDNVVLENAYKAVGSPIPWGFRNNRCFRTLKAIAPWDLSLTVPAVGTHHNALDDARYQALLAVQYLRRIPR